MLPWWRRAGISRGRRFPVAVRRWSITVVAATLAAGTDAHALTARVRWTAASGATVAGYDVFVRRSGEGYGTAVDAGLPPEGAGGALAYDVHNLADGAVYYFTVTARGTNGGRSLCPGEVVLGNSDACVNERCCPGQPCTLITMPNGAPCDHTNPCRVCRAAACTTATESAMDTPRVRLTDGAAAARGLAIGSFIPAGAFAPAADGVGLSVLDETGAVLLTAFAPPDALRANTAGTSFVLAPDRRDTTLTMLNLRLRNGAVRARARFRAYPGTSADSLAWGVASGGSCGRSTALTCSVTAHGVSCR